MVKHSCVVWRVHSDVLKIHSVVKITPQILFVEAHGRGDGACGPVDRDICQEVIQAEFSAQMTQFLISHKPAAITNLAE